MRDNNPFTMKNSSPGIISGSTTPEYLLPLILVDQAITRAFLWHGGGLGLETVVQKTNIKKQGFSEKEDG